MKNVTRSAWTTEGKRGSVAEHSWRLGLMALVLAPAFPEVNAARLMQLCLVHYLGEALRGDYGAVSPRSSH
jgi:putative hydrolases of HD superfamily